MQVLDMDGTDDLRTDDALLARLRSARRGHHGAFVLSHDENASLWIHINGEAAFLWYLADNDGRHPGFVPDNMWPGERQEVEFQLVNGFESDTITVPWWQLVPLDVAYQAAVEFLHSESLPASVTWFEL